MVEPTLKDFLKPISAALDHDQIARHIKAPDTHFVSELEGAPQDDLVKHFENEASAVGTAVAHAKAGSIGPVLTSMLSHFKCTSVVFANDKRIDKERIPTILQVAKIPYTRWNAKNPEDSRHVCAKADAGVTFPLAGIAETGTVVQQSDADCGRSISLLPPTYIAIVNASDIVASLQDAFDAVSKKYGKDLPSNITCITGPSTTSDIELVRVVGVHGPVHTAVIIVDDR